MTRTAEIDITTYDRGGKHLSSQQVIFEDAPSQEKEVVNLYPFMKYQTIEGFGATFTEAAAYTFFQMSESSREAFLEACFGKNGLHYNQTRMALDSRDASLGNYSAMDDKDDEKLDSFSLERDEKYILPFYRAVTEKRGEPITVMLSPWSPPAFMKSNGEKNHGGVLKKEYYGLWAEYFCRFIEEYRNKGVDVRRISIQNEPNAVQTWDSCCYSGVQERHFLKRYLYPALQKHGLTDLEIYIWDHNKERMVERAREVIDAETDHMVDGIGFHWYSGDHFEALSIIKELYPDKKLAFTEGCVEYSIFSAEDPLANARMYGHDMIGNLNNGAAFLVNWSILFNGQGGPNHVQNWCEAPIMYHEETDRLEFKLSWDYIRHFSGYITPGSVRIGSSRFTDDIDVTAAERPDGKLVAVLMNRKGEERTVYLRLDGQVAKLILPGDSIATAVIG
ncbi:glycoside hydrolase family 30 beta sandwich domain-containing protein [Ruminococcus sp. 5_1_39BFAA]|uniref:glycoside hydrolase family 30 protein n=1 Tax=Ruminococcus sp. 5_1_39BFAA TaxID=457412 RepID=UPI0035651714